MSGSTHARVKPPQKLNNTLSTGVNIVQRLGEHIATIVNIFHERLGPPNNEEAFIAYLQAVSCPPSDTLQPQLHHILPKSVFPEFKSLVQFPWNGVYLSVESHRAVHCLLFQAYSIPSFRRPLNFMAPEYYPTPEEMSVRSKWIWQQIKSDPESLQSWCRKKSDQMKKVMVPGNYTYEALMAGSRRRHSQPGSSQAISDFHKALWQDPEYREKQMASRSKSEEEDAPRREAISARLKEMYEDPEYYSRHQETMTEVNKREEKRNKAGAALKKRWQDPIYRDNVLRRRREAEEARKAERESRGEPRTNAKTKALWDDPVWKAWMLEQRRIKRDERRRQQSLISTKE